MGLASLDFGITPLLVMASAKVFKVNRNWTRPVQQVQDRNVMLIRMSEVKRPLVIGEGDSTLQTAKSETPPLD